MSAIWGAISLDGKEIPEEHIKYLRDGFEKCKIDRYEEIRHQNAYLGCGIQYFNEEAKKEVLPCENDNILFTADVVIDNRTELLEKLGIEDNTVPDGYLLNELYRRYGNEGVNYPTGVFTAVWFDQQKKTIDVWTDCMGCRYIYYLQQDGIFYFASLMKPLIQIIHKREINEEFFADFLSEDSPIIFSDIEKTTVEGIYRIPPAHCMHVDIDNTQKVEYWLPVDKKEKK